MQGMSGLAPGLTYKVSLTGSIHAVDSDGPKVQCWMRGGWGSNRAGLEGKEEPPLPDPAAQRSMERGRWGRVSGAGPRREARALSLPRAITLPQAFLTSQTSVSIGNRRRFHPDPCPLYQTWWDLPGGRGLTCSEQLPIHTQRIACNGPAAGTGVLSDQGFGQAGPDTHTHSRPELSPVSLVPENLSPCRGHGRLSGEL